MSEPERKFIAPTVGEFDQLNDALTTAMVTMVECYKGRPRGSLSEIEQAVLPFLKIVAQYQGMTLQALGVLVETGGQRLELATALKTAIGHIEHMSKFIADQKAGYSFESLGEDMGIIREPLDRFEAERSPAH